MDKYHRGDINPIVCQVVTGGAGGLTLGLRFDVKKVLAAKAYVVLIAAIIALTCFYVWLNLPPQMASAFDGYDGAEEIALSWSEDATIYQITSVYHEVRGGESTQWEYFFYSPSSAVGTGNATEYSILVVIVPTGGDAWTYGFVQGRKRPQELRMDSTEAYSMLDGNPIYESWLENYPSKRPAMSYIRDRWSVYFEHEPTDSYAQFYIDDATGEVEVNAYSMQGEALMEVQTLCLPTLIILLVVTLFVGLLDVPERRSYPPRRLRKK